MTVVYIGIGSNVGNREANINRAISLLREQGVTNLRLSPLYDNPAICRPGETMPNFLNGVVEIETQLPPEILLDHLEAVERELGRKEKGDWRPRTIDLDILFYGSKVYESKRLKIPHPEVERRWFVLKPMADLRPEMVHPVLKKTIKEIYANFH